MGKIGSTILTFLFSVPVTAVGWMAIFGVPPIASLNASPSEDVVIRDPFEQDPWGNSFQDQPAANPTQDAPLYGGHQHDGHAHHDQPLGDHDRRLPISRPHSFPEQSPSQNPKRSFDNHQMSSSPQGHVLPNSRQFPNQPSNSSENRLGLHSEPHAHSETTAQAPTIEMRNPFAGGVGNGSTRPNTTETSAQMLSWQEASARLTELGIKKYHLERGGEEGMFLFVCLYHPSETPQVTHRFEAEGNEPLIAVNQVLSQVDGWLQQQYRESHKIVGFPTR